MILDIILVVKVNEIFGRHSVRFGLNSGWVRCGSNPYIYKSNNHQKINWKSLIISDNLEYQKSKIMGC